ncbi:Putative glycoprotein/receptor [Raoultella terrigena]|uniref:Glycoprotein/receptor n=1 Tax=Raoultella terrigena TaxID=577 RepID=A0A7Z9CTQ6_RAOTE|nr:Putative glycoprotein/receptor [Raoultella terrigena]
MKSAKSLLRCSVAATAFLVTGAQAASWQDSLSSAASELSSQSGSQQSGALSMSSLTSLLNGGSQSLTASSMNNAAGIMSYCAKQKLSSVTNTENVKNQVLDKLGLGTPEKQKEDTGYLEGLQGLLNSNNGQQLNLSTLGSSPLAEKVKTQACDLVLKQGAKFLS